jgi:hypothetical protein
LGNDLLRHGLAVQLLQMSVFLANAHCDLKIQRNTSNSQQGSMYLLLTNPLRKPNVQRFKKKGSLWMLGLSNIQEDDNYGFSFVIR